MQTTWTQIRLLLEQSDQGPVFASMIKSSQKASMINSNLKASMIKSSLKASMIKSTLRASMIKSSLKDSMIESSLKCICIFAADEKSRQQIFISKLIFQNKLFN